MPTDPFMPHAIVALVLGAFVLQGWRARRLLPTPSRVANGIAGVAILGALITIVAAPAAPAARWVPWLLVLAGVLVLVGRLGAIRNAPPGRE